MSRMELLGENLDEPKEPEKLAEDLVCVKLLSSQTRVLEISVMYKRTEIHSWLLPRQSHGGWWSRSLVVLIVWGLVGPGYSAVGAEPAALCGPSRRTTAPSLPEIIISGPPDIGEIRLWVPEAVMAVPGAAAIYPRGQPWRREGGSLRQVVENDEIFDKHQVRRLDNDTIEFHKMRLALAGPVRWESEVRRSDDGVSFTIRLTNRGTQTIRQAAAAVCVKFLDGAKWWNDDRVMGVFEGRLQPLSQLGRTESRFYRPNPFQLYLLRGQTFDNPFYRDVWGVNPHRLDRPLLISEHRAAGLCVVVSAQRAYFLHCNHSNPCTDLMLAFGDLGPGKTADATGQVSIRRGTAAQVLTNWPAGADNVLRDLQYVEGGHERNRLDLYLPEKAEGRLPLVVWIHGGAWMGGSKDGCPAVPLTAKGYAVASINYRLSQHAVFPAQIEDCKAAIRWLRANAAKYHLDATASASGANRPAATWSPCSAPRATRRSWRAGAGTSTSPAACSAS